MIGFYIHRFTSDRHLTSRCSSLCARSECDSCHKLICCDGGNFMYDYYSLISSFIYTQRLVATILQSGDRHFLQTFHEGQVGGLCRFIVSFLFVNDDKRLRVCSTRPLCAIGIMAVYFLYIIHNVCGAFGIRQAHYTVFALLKILM